MSPDLTIDRAANLRLQAMAAVRAHDFERAQQLRAQADKLDQAEAIRREMTR